MAAVGKDDETADMASPPESSKAGIRFVGRYALLGRLASGGMATVHVGRLMGPVGFTRSVAIKRLHPEYARDPSFVSMFLDEARLAAQISHPNVVSTLDVVATDGELFLVMDYVHGQSLSWLVRQSARAGTRIPPRIVASIISGCLQGLHAAHEARDERGVPLNIVHRDVSPQNMIVGADGLSRVLDFGVAKAVGRIQNTREGHIKGKLAYMPPEQIQTDTVSRQADVYASAVVLWEALTGSRLFKAETEAGTLAKILSGTVPAPSTIAAEVPPALDRVVLKGLAREPSKRYATAREMALDLERAIPVASVVEVSDWLERVAKKELDERSARIAAIEMSAGLNGSQNMQHLAQALSKATTLSPEDDTSESHHRAALRADTVPTAIQPPGANLVTEHDVGDGLTQPHASQPSLGGDQHSGESASQLSSVSLAMGRPSVSPHRTRNRTAGAAGILVGAAAIGAIMWLAVGRTGAASAPAASPPAAAPPAATLAPVIEPKPAQEATATATAAAPKEEAPPVASATASAPAPERMRAVPKRNTPQRRTPKSPFDDLGGRE